MVIRLNLQLFIYSIASVKLVRSRGDLLFWFHTSILSGVIVASSLKARCTSQGSPCRNGRRPRHFKHLLIGHIELLLNFLKYRVYRILILQLFVSIFTYKKLIKSTSAKQVEQLRTFGVTLKITGRGWAIDIEKCVGVCLLLSDKTPLLPMTTCLIHQKATPPPNSEWKSIRIWTCCLGDTFQNCNSNSKQFGVSVRGRRRPDRIYFLSLTFASSAGPRQLRLSREPRLGNGI